ncbi:MAG: hypothetical protein ACRDDJ_21535 [[Mycobacterium] stephanolepidis]
MVFARYVAGCRCDQCFTAQRAREAQIATEEKHRWSPTTQRAHQARMQRAPLREQHQQSSTRGHITATEQARQRYQQAIARKDYCWVLDVEQRTLNSVRTHTRIRTPHLGLATRREVHHRDDRPTQLLSPPVQSARHADKYVVNREPVKTEPSRTQCGDGPEIRLSAKRI